MSPLLQPRVAVIIASWLNPVVGEVNGEIASEWKAGAAENHVKKKKMRGFRAEKGEETKCLTANKLQKDFFFGGGGSA